MQPALTGSRSVTFTASATVSPSATGLAWPGLAPDDPKLKLDVHADVYSIDDDQPVPV